MHRLKYWFAQIFLYPRVTLGSDENYWKSRNRGATPSLSAWQKQRADLALSYMDTRTASVLDVGSGDGGVLHYMKTKIQNFSGTGIDRDEGARRALSTLGFLALDVDLTKSTSLDTLPECDYALMFEIIEHVPQSEELVAAARRVAKRGVFFSVPNTGFFTYRLRLLFGKFPAQCAERPNEHVRFWTLRDMHWWLKAQGIENASVHTYEGVPYLRSLFPSLFAAGIMVWIPHV